MTEIIVISGPGGVGKGTVVAELLQRDRNLRVSRSWTTRDQRPGEADDAYTFVDEKTFLAAVEDGKFLEWDHHFGNYYGSPVPTSDDTNDLILEIDVNGGKQIHDGAYEALFIFIDTPSVDEQRARMLNRGDSLPKVEERLIGGQRERELAATMPYVRVINDDVERCTSEIAALVSEHRTRASSNMSGTEQDC